VSEGEEKQTLISDSPMVIITQLELHYITMYMSASTR